MTETSEVFIEVKKPEEENYEILFKEKFITEKMKESLEIGNISYSFLKDIDLTGFSTRKDLEIRVRCAQTEGNWKSNWIFEGISI